MLMRQAIPLEKYLLASVIPAKRMRDMASERTLFYKILLVKSGSVKFEVVLGTESAEDEKHQLTASDLLVVSPKHYCPSKSRHRKVEN